MKRNFFIASFFLLLMGAPPRESFCLLQGNRVILVDDFEHPETVNLLGGESPKERVLREAAWGGVGASAVLEYDLDEGLPYSFFSIGLGKKDSFQKVDGAQNFSEMGYLSFWVKTEAPSEGTPVDFFVELHEDSNGDGKFVLGRDQSSRVPIARLSKDSAGTPWQKVVVPLYQFRSLRNRERLLEIVFVFQIKRGQARGKVFVDNLLFGSDYPEGMKGREIPMQNRVSSFKIANTLAAGEMKVKRGKTPLTLTLVFVDPYLEEIRFEMSPDNGRSWQRIHSFYDHRNGGIYSADWETKSLPRNRTGVPVRAVGVNVLGGESELAGPYRIHFR